MPKVTLEDINGKVGKIINEVSSICYDSDPEKNRIKNLQKWGHLSCFRFTYFTFRIEEISRPCSTQLLRHKHLEYMQESMRYVNQKNAKFITPKTITNTTTDSTIFNNAIDVCQRAYNLLIKNGIPKEDARYILPLATQTKMYITGNLQAWINFINLRTTKKAQWEIRDVANQIKKIIKQYIPDINI